MHDESDPAFIRRMLAEIDAQTPENGTVPGRVTLKSEDLIRLVRLYTGLPPTAMRIN